MDPVSLQVSFVANDPAALKPFAGQRVSLVRMALANPNPNDIHLMRLVEMNRPVADIRRNKQVVADYEAFCCKLCPNNSITPFPIQARTLESYINFMCGFYRISTIKSYVYRLCFYQRAYKEMPVDQSVANHSAFCLRQISRASFPSAKPTEGKPALTKYALRHIFRCAPDSALGALEIKTMLIICFESARRGQSVSTLTMSDFLECKPTSKSGVFALRILVRNRKGIKDNGLGVSAESIILEGRLDSCGDSLEDSLDPI
jgi:hypothetical protein